MAISVATLIDKAKALADRRNDASIPDTDWYGYVNDGVEDLYRYLVSLDQSLYFQQSNFTLVGGIAGATFDLTTLNGSKANTGFRALHGLDLNPDTTNRRTIVSRNFRNRNLGVVGFWLPTIIATDRRYDLRGALLNVTPYEGASGSYRIYWREAPYKFVSAVDAVTLDFQLEPYDEWIRIMAARTALGIEESEQGVGSNRLAELRESIAAVARRDDEPASIADVEDDGPGWSWPA
jgi:hypothetical protein